MSPFEKQRVWKILDFFVVSVIGIFLSRLLLENKGVYTLCLLPFSVALLWVILMDGVGVYEYENLNSLKNSTVCLIFSVAIVGYIYALACYEFAYKVRSFLALHVILSFLCLILIRAFAIQSGVLNKFRKKIIVTLPNYGNTVDFLVNHPEYEVLNVVKVNPVLTEEAEQILERADADEIIVNYGHLKDHEFAKRLLNKGHRASCFEDIYEGLTGKISLDFIDNKAYLAKFLAEVKEDRLYDFLKRLLDLIGAAIAGVIYLFVFPLIAIAVKMDSEGPIFYKHKRRGKDGKLFTIWKIRTMVKDAERNGAQWAKEGDPRITRVGRILRKTRLDEFPQIFNILKGEMSIIGPRPERPEHEKELKKHIPSYDLRYLVKPGMAGWAMVNYGYIYSIKDAKIRHEYDLYYIKNRGFFLDFKIFLRALKQLVLFKGR